MTLFFSPKDQATLKMGGYWNSTGQKKLDQMDQATLKMGGYWNFGD